MIPLERLAFVHFDDSRGELSNRHGILGAKSTVSGDGRLSEAERQSFTCIEGELCREPREKVSSDLTCIAIVESCP